MSLRETRREQKRDHRRKAEKAAADEAYRADSRLERHRRLIRRYVAAGRDYRCPERLSLEAALREADGPVECDGYVWGWSAAERSIVRARALRKPHSQAIPPADGAPRVFKTIWRILDGPRYDLIAMSPEQITEG